MKKSALKLAIAASMFASVGAFAVTADSGYGTAALPSSGTVDVKLLKGDAASLTNLNELNFNVVTASSFSATVTSISVSDLVCIFSTLTDIAIDVTSLGGSAGQNAMVGPNGSLMNYSLELNTVALIDGDVGTLVSNAGNNNDPTCGAGSALNGNLTATVTDTDFNNAADAGAYSDTVTLTVSPL